MGISRCRFIGGAAVRLTGLKNLNAAVLCGASVLFALVADAEPNAGNPGMALVLSGRRVTSFDRAQAVLRKCRTMASAERRIRGFRVPFYAPGGSYGANWWQLDHSVAVLGVKWSDSADAARGLDGFADVIRADGRIPLYGNDVLPKRKGWFSEQSEGVSSLPAFFRAAHDVAVWRGDRAFARRMADLSFRYLGWWLQARGDPKTGLVTAVFEETFPPYLGNAGECASPGTCAEVAHGAALTADLYRRLGDAVRERTCRDMSRKLYEAARTHLWSAEDAQFRPRDVRTRGFLSADALGFSLLQDPDLPDSIRNAARAMALGPRYREQGRFGLTSVARDDGRFKITRGDRYQGNDSWSGMVWTLINVRVIDGLLASGFEADAVALAKTTVRMLEAEDDFYEFYDPTDGKGCGVRGYAWTAADYLQIVLGRLLGISYDGFARKLTVRPRISEDFCVTGIDVPGRGRATIRQVKGTVMCTFDPVPDADPGSSLLVDVTKSPYCADNTGRIDCTKALVKVLDDILVREVEAYEATVKKLKRLSDDGKADVHIGLEGGRVEDGRMKIVYPEKVPPTRIVYFPKGTYLVSDTVTYSLKDLKASYYDVPYFDNCRNINFLGESRDETVIRLVDNAPGFSSGEMKPLVSFVNNEKKLPRNKEVSNIAFMNFMRNLTLDCGKGNPDAVGVRFIASNVGRLENLTIRTERGRSGVYTMCSTQGVFENLEVSGFDYGLDICNSAMIVIDGLDVTGVRKAGLLTGNSPINAAWIVAGDRPAAEFAEGMGRCYFRDHGLKFPDDRRGNHVYFEDDIPALRDMRFPPRPETGSDFAFVDDFGARGDGTIDSAPAVQKAMNSGKSTVVFGSGEYLLNGKVKVPKGVRKIDFRFCSLAAGIRLVGGEYDAAFEISEDASEPLAVECLDAWENLRGHFRLFKHAAKRDAVFRDIHLMSASLYFNTVPGSRVWLDNVFLTTGTYTQPGVIAIPGSDFAPVYSRIIPLEFHGQKVYGRQVNLERADVHVLNDASEILFDCYRTEGPGTALRGVNGGRTRINLFNSGIGFKAGSRALFDLEDSDLELTGSLSFGFDRTTEYNVIVNSVRGGKAERLLWDDVKVARGGHVRLIDFYVNRKE